MNIKRLIVVIIIAVAIAGIGLLAEYYFVFRGFINVPAVSAPEKYDR